MELCSLNLSMALQELGYDGEYTYCHVGVYPKNEYQIMTLSECEKYRHDIGVLCAAPRIDDAAYWLRDKHDIFVDVSYSWANGGWFYSLVKFNPLSALTDPDGYDTYDEALEAGVAGAINIIQKNQQQ